MILGSQEFEGNRDIEADLAPILQKSINDRINEVNTRLKEIDQEIQQAPAPVSPRLQRPQPPAITPARQMQAQAHQAAAGSNVKIS